VSAGLLMFRRRNGVLEVFIAHPGGPWFPHRDFDVWTIPKGEIEPIIAGTAHVNSEATLLLDERDPFCWGIR
jgi:predicted NUDIX family NTP pyrophosphohydrolase